MKGIIDVEASGADCWMAEQLFEEDVRAILKMLRPNRRERLEGWSEYRTGGSEFRVTVSWSKDCPQAGEMHVWRVPRIAEVLEALLVGSVRGIDEIPPHVEFQLYRDVVDQLRRRLDELEPCYT